MKKKRRAKCHVKHAGQRNPRPSGLYQRYWQYNEREKKKIEGIDESVISPNKIRGKGSDGGGKGCTP
jgi:hypothetical protein